VLVITIVLVSATLAVLLAHQAQRPIVVLAEAVARIRGGDFSTPIPDVRAPELVPLAEELEQARHPIQVKLRTIADAEQHQRALFAALHEPILTTSEDGRISGFNTAAARLLGGAVRLYGQRLDEILPFVDTSAEASDEARWRGRVSTTTGVNVDVEVSRTRVAAETFPLTDIYVLHDVTRYVELSQLREQLLYSVAHEVRGPLSTLDNVLDILAHEYGGLTPDELSRLARSARGTAARLHNVVETLLSAGAIQSGRFEVHPAPSWLSEIVDDAIQAALPLTEARSQRIEQHLPADDVRILADRRYVRQLLWNLLSNASKYSPDSGLIRLCAEVREDHVRVTVVDRGPGIPVEQQAGLFERFYRAQSSGRTEGIGLGLAIAKAIVDAHGGDIGVDSAPGQGTRVWFTLPLVGRRAD
jgi:signal transduction histidine kinase